MQLADLDELRDRLTPDEQAVLKALLTGSGAGQFQPLEPLAETVGQPLDNVLTTLRLFDDLQLVELREPEKMVRMRAGGILANRKSKTILDRFAIVGQIWGQLSQGSKRLAKIATGLIGLVVFGQVIGAIQSIATAIYSLVMWLGK